MLGDQIVHYLYYLTMKMIAWETKMIIALIIEVKISLLHFFSFFHYYIKLQSINLSER